MRQTFAAESAQHGTSTGTLAHRPQEIPRNDVQLVMGASIWTDVDICRRISLWCLLGTPALNE